MDNLISIVVRTAKQDGISRAQLLDMIDREYVTDALDQARGNQCRAARLLGLHRNTLQRHMSRLGIQVKGRGTHYGKNSISSAPPTNGAETAKAANSVRKGGRGESPELPEQSQQNRSSGLRENSAPAKFSAQSSHPHHDRVAQPPPAVLSSGRRSS